MTADPVLSKVSAVLEANRESPENTTHELFSMLYEELHRLARSKLAKEPPGITLQATALVHEAYLRLLKDSQAEWDCRGHLFCAAAEAMRRILVENARARASKKRGGNYERVPVEKIVHEDLTRTDLLALEDALAAFEPLFPRAARVVKLRYFAALEIEEIASLLGISSRSIARDWQHARAWLVAEMTGRSDPGKRS